MTKNVIELNGQKYDALTGKPISGSTSAKKALSKSAASKQIDGPKHLDGFRRRPSSPKPHVSTTSKAIHHKTQKSQTLMRTAVKAPKAPAKIHAKTAAHPVTPTATIAQPRLEVAKPGRIIRAQHISQSNLISKFGKSLPPVKTAVLSVKPAPVDSAVKPEVTPAIPPLTHHETNLAPPVTAARKTTTKPSKKEAMLQSAIEHAASHQQPRQKKAKVHHRIAHKLRVSPRLVTATGMTLMVLSVGGILAYQNMPELSMKIASTRAGLNAKLPSYQPAGFAMAGPIKYDHGEVTINYKSNSDDRAFDVTQKNSSWNSETLLENYVTPNGQPYQTFQAKGRTIYIYDGNKATWVDGGIWYNIDGKTNLNSDQLLRIANSL